MKDVEHINGKLYIVRVLTETDPDRYSWLAAEFGETAELLRTSTTHNKRAARRIAQAWSRGDAMMDKSCDCDSCRSYLAVTTRGQHALCAGCAHMVDLHGAAVGVDAHMACEQSYVHS